MKRIAGVVSLSSFRLHPSSFQLVDWEGFKPSQEVCRTSMLSLHHQPENLVAVGGLEPPTSRL